MVRSGSLFALVAVVLLAVTVSGSNVKLASCCTSVANKKITEPILGYLVQPAKAPCVKAVIFQTQSGLFCINGRAPWVRATITAFEKAKAQSTSVHNINKITPSEVPTSPVSLLSIITSTASPSSSSTSEMSGDETFSESRNE